MNGKGIAFLSVFCLFISLPTRAELVWEKTELELHPTPGDSKTVGVFKCQNKGDKPIHFTSLRTSCGCVDATTPRNDVPPGGKGEITATYSFGNRIGLQQQRITVETDEAQTPATVLTLKATIAQLLELQPTTVSWESGEEPKTKTIVVRIAKGAPIKKLEVKPSSAEFTAKVEPGPADEFKINVQPRSTAKRRNEIVTITPQLPSGPGKEFYAHVVVEPPAPPKRPFDAVSGIIISCQPASNVSWTSEGCTHLIAEVQRRAAESKVRVSVQPSQPNLASKKFGDTNGFNGDKAVRMALTFEESSEEKGRVNLTLSSSVIWEPTAEDIPGIAPGQRFQQNFYLQGILFDPDIPFTHAQRYMKTMLDGFFTYGEGKP